MKSIIKMFRRKTVRCLFILTLAVFSSQIATAQGTITYLSNVGQAPAGNIAVGSDSWLSALFLTGNNAGGYLLDSVQFGMAGATGNPTGFTVMVYSQASIIGVSPGSSLGTLSGPANPTAAGNYTYAPVSSLELSPNNAYFIVVTAGTTVANGAYEWSYVSASNYNPNGGWLAGDGSKSSDGSSWNIPTPGYFQFAIYATPAPEPGVLGLFALGGLLVAFQRRKTRPVQ